MEVLFERDFTVRFKTEAAYLFEKLIYLYTRIHGVVSEKAPSLWLLNAVSHVMLKVRPALEMFAEKQCESETNLTRSKDIF